MAGTAGSSTSNPPLVALIRRDEEPDGFGRHERRLLPVGRLAHSDGRSPLEVALLHSGDAVAHPPGGVTPRLFLDRLGEGEAEPADGRGGRVGWSGGSRALVGAEAPAVPLGVAHGEAPGPVVLVPQLRTCSEDDGRGRLVLPIVSMTDILSGAAP